MGGFIPLLISVGGHSVRILAAVAQKLKILISRIFVFLDWVRVFPLGLEMSPDSPNTVWAPGLP